VSHIQSGLLLPLTLTSSTELFRKAFDHIAERIDRVYKDLTKGKAAPMGGVAYLNLEDSEEPYLSGVTFHAMPPMKRFRDMDQLSGGEKTVAALALLFAIHRWVDQKHACLAPFSPPF
jgi:structural maintenance of chromosome 1